MKKYSPPPLYEEKNSPPELYCVTLVGEKEFQDETF